MRRAMCMALSLGAAASLPVAAQAQPVAPAAQQAAQATGDFGQARACPNWLSPLDIAALGLAAEETLAVAKAQGVAIPASAPQQPCSDAAARARVTAAAQGFSNTLLLRAQALAAMTDPVGFQLATAYEQKAALDTAASRLKANATAAGRGAVFDQLAAKQQQEAAVIASMACAARRTVRSPKGRPCPPIPPAAQADVPAAMAMLASAEAFSQRLATEMAAAAPPPMNRLWSYDMLASMLAGGGRPATEPAKCVGGELLLYLTDPRALRASNERGDVLYAPAIRLDGKAPPDWRVIVMLKGEEGALVALPGGGSPDSLLTVIRRVQLPNWDETRIRDTANDPALRAQWAKDAVAAAFADLVAGAQMTVYRRCG